MLILIVFLTAVVINVVPLFMPPTWLILAFFYKNFVIDALVLAVVGAIGSTTGRIMLSYLGTYFRRFASKERNKDMDIVGKMAKKNPIKSFFVTFLFSLSPFPSNVYFLTVGLAKARIIPIFAGFFAGRVISYYLLIQAAQALFSKIEDIFSSKLTQVLVIDLVGIAFMFLFIMVDWPLLLKKRKLRFIPLKLPWKK